MTDQVPESASQAFGISLSELAAAAHSEHDMLAPTANAPAGLVLTSQAADILVSRPALVSSISAPHHSPTAGIVSPGNKMC